MERKKSKREKIKEVFIPKWLAWFNLVLMILIIFLIIYINYIVPESEKIPLFGLIFLILMFTMIIVIIFFSAYRKLPIYYIREK